MKHIQSIKQTQQKKQRLNKLNLRYLNQIWYLQYRTNIGASSQLSEDTAQKRLIITAKKNNTTIIKKLLGLWLKNKAAIELTALLQKLAQRHHFRYNKLNFRGQKTLWGSCSSQKNISINYKLLFLPKPLVEYVMIHELSHTIYMNHSVQFWQLVKKCDPNYKQHNAALKKQTIIDLSYD